ncbi:phospholipid scramblase family protein [Flavobacteriaceae bacterium]|nr:phospholipid scramblase family protein [Flavobacteriaceae bacterium]MDB4240422.1 phospholipid scramblase family protein [Flavobacteriaceae bacterium]
MKKNLQKNIFLFKEHLGLFKASNNYDVYDPKTKEIILHCREKNLNPLYKIVRMFLTDFKIMTPFEIDIRGLDGKKIIKVKKGLSLILSKIEVFDENDKLIGLFKQKSFSFAGNFEIFDEKENLVSKLKGGVTGWNFKFLKDENTIATVTKKWSGIGKEMFTSADNYILEIKDNVDKTDSLRLLIFAAVISIDMVFKE